MLLGSFWRALPGWSTAAFALAFNLFADPNYLLFSRAQLSGRLSSLVSQINYNKPKFNAQLAHWRREASRALPQPFFAQRHFASDDFKQVPDQPKPDSEAATELNDLLNSGRQLFEQNQSDAALIVFQKLQKRAVELEDLVALGVAHSWLGLTLSRLKRHSEAVECHQADLKAAEALNDDAARYRALTNLGSVYFNLRDFVNAAEFKQKSIELTTKAGHPREIALLWGTLGVCYSSLGRKDEALLAHQNELTLLETSDDLSAKARSLQRIGNLLESFSRHSEEVEIYKQLVEVHKQLGQTREQMTTSAALGTALLNDKQLEAAVTTLKEALESAKEQKNVELQISILGNLGIAKVAQKRPQEGIKFHVKELELAQQFTTEDSDGPDPRSLQMEAHIHLGKAFLANKEFELAMMEFNRWLDLAMDLNDTDQQKQALSALKAVADEQNKGDFSQAK